MTGEPTRIRPAAVAGTFYPARAGDLRAIVATSLADAVVLPAGASPPKALVVPHAGLRYSGPIAASAYLRLVPIASAIERVVLLGPSHRVAFRGIATSTADAFETPLGRIRLDVRGAGRLRRLPGVVASDVAHAREHSLEVQLPFLQTLLGDVLLLPLVVGDATAAEVAAVVEDVWDDPGTVVVVSTDLSHYHRHEDAMVLDARTAASIVAARPEAVGDRDACGSRPLRGLLRVVGERGLHVEQLDLRTSADTCGDPDRVVGYGAFAVA